MNRFIIRNRDVKFVKPKDFDNAAFKRGEFDIAICSPEDVRKTLRFLSERGYVWGGSKTSLLKDSHMREQLLQIIRNEPIYITIDRDAPNGVLRASAYLLYTSGAVEIDFEEDKNMNETKKVKAKDFDWDGFSHKKFHIAMSSKQSVISTLQFLSEKGYVWGMSLSSLIKDEEMRDRLCGFAKQGTVYITCGGLVHNGVVRDFVLPIDTDTAVEIDFEEEHEMTTFEEVNAKDFNWEAFHDDQIAIAVDNRDMDNLDKVMELLKGAGYYWAGTNTPLSAKHAFGYKAITDGSHGHITYLSTNGRESDHHVYWSTEYSGRERPVKIVFEERIDNNKIVITNDGKITTATLYSNGKKAGVGTAICHDDDKFDVYAGSKLALERLEKNKKKVETTDWERFVKGEVNMRVPKKYIQDFLYRTVKDGLTFKGKMPDWYLRWLTQDGDSIVVAVIGKYAGSMFMSEVLRDDGGTTVDYIPGMK